MNLVKPGSKEQVNIPRDQFSQLRIGQGSYFMTERTDSIVQCIPATVKPARWYGLRLALHEREEQL
jgi:hypothetical protein